MEEIIRGKVEEELKQKERELELKNNMVRAMEVRN
jgi:hypothetical protein